MDLDVDIMPDLEAWVEHLQDVTRASLQTVYLLARHQFPELSAEEAADKAGDLFRGLLVRAVGTAGEAFKYSEEAADGGACQADTRSPASGSGLLPWQHMPPGSLNLRLIHFCKAQGCIDPLCQLCANNPQHVCRRSLKPMYLEREEIKAACNQPISCVVVDASGHCVEDVPNGYQMEFHILDGLKSQEWFGPQPQSAVRSILDKCTRDTADQVLLVRKGHPEIPAPIILPLENGRAPVTEMSCPKSSEAALQKRAPPLRLLVRLLDAAGRPVPEIPAMVTEDFVVVTRRVKNDMKPEILLVTDDASKIKNVGDKTLKKLHNLRGAAQEAGMALDVPASLNRVDTVERFQQLVQWARDNQGAEKGLRSLLKLCRSGWPEAIEHAFSAVVIDNRPRMWMPRDSPEGLVFSTKLGSVDMTMPMGYIIKEPATGQLTVCPRQRAPQHLVPRLNDLRDFAAEDWESMGHPDWSIIWYCPQDPMAEAAVGNVGVLIEGVAAALLRVNQHDALLQAAAAASSASLQHQQPHLDQMEVEAAPAVEGLAQLHHEW